MNAVEKRIRKIAVSLINADTYTDIVEVMHTIAYYMDDYSAEMNAYFSGLYDYIGETDKDFRPLSSDEKYRIENMGARLILNPNAFDTVSVFVKLHNMLRWHDGEDAMIVLTDKLYSIAEKD